jgi:hypothetical protein
VEQKSVATVDQRTNSEGKRRTSSTAASPTD